MELVSLSCKVVLVQHPEWKQYQHSQHSRFWKSRPRLIPQKTVHLEQLNQNVEIFQFPGSENKLAYPLDILVDSLLLSKSNYYGRDYLRTDHLKKEQNWHSYTRRASLTRPALSLTASSLICSKDTVVTSLLFPSRQKVKSQ